MNPNPPALPAPVPAPVPDWAPRPLRSIDIGDLATALTARAVAPDLAIRCPPGARFRHAARRLGHHLRMTTGTVSTVRVVTAPAADIAQTPAPPDADSAIALALSVAVGCTAPNDLANTEAVGLCWYAVTGCSACRRLAMAMYASY